MSKQGRGQLPARMSISVTRAARPLDTAERAADFALMHFACYYRIGG
jgi:hypothetical protein